MKESINILVIDDNEDDRLLYRRALQKQADAEYVIFEADDGEEAQKQIKERLPDCLLLDYSLPGRNGVEVLKRIRASYPYLPVVMLTGQGNEEVAVSAIQQGAQNYISKSNITPEALQRVVHVAIEHCALKKRVSDQRASLEVFTRALAHDLKEPVRTIRSFVELIEQQEQFGDKTQGYFTHIRNAAERMHMLIDMVYYYTRLEDPRQVARENCDASAVLNEVLENIDHLIHERGATIASEPLPAVSANRTQLIQLLQNLLSNAIKHSKAPCDIKISAKQQEGECLFSVSDNGPGIESAYLEKIFDPFKRLSRNEDGAGLGLAICRKIVESHNSHIWCESTPGEGTTFYFTLPIATPALANHDVGIADTPQLSGHPLAKILVVDDSKADLEITRFRLMEKSKLQCELIIAGNGEEAIQRLHDEAGNGAPVDLVLLDINMPEMDGFELLEHIRADKMLADLPVVMCTGSIYDKDMERAQQMGAVGYLTKPVEFSRLKSVIDTIPAFKLHKINSGYTLVRAA